MVRPRNSSWPLRLPSWADQTAIAIVSELPIRTAVLTPPSTTSSSWLASAKAWGYVSR